MIRVRIELNTEKDVLKFINALTAANDDNYLLTSGDGKYVASARSLLGAMYMSADCGGDLWVVNETNDGIFPATIDCFRKEN